MKIASVQTDVLEVTVENPYVAAGRNVDANWHVLTRVTTEDGIEGFGYVVKLGPQLVKVIAEASRELGQSLIGMNVTEPEAAWCKLTGLGKWVGPGGLLHWAIAPLDIALWDAAGKVLQQPLYRLLGGFRNEVPAYASEQLWYSLSLDELAQSAQDHAEAGYTAIKLRLGKDATPAEQAERVRVAGAAAGAGVGVMVDGTESWDFNYARLAGVALQDAGAVWLEDPVLHDEIENLAQLSAELQIPVTGGENLYTLSQFRQTLAARAVDVAILDLFRVGGITPWRKIAALAESYRVPVSGHVAPEFHIHLLAAIPNGEIVEYMPRSTVILEEMPKPENGILAAPDAPGHGLVLDMQAVQRCRVG